MDSMAKMISFLFPNSVKRETPTAAEGQAQFKAKVDARLAQNKAECQRNILRAMRDGEPGTSCKGAQSDEFVADLESKGHRLTFGNAPPNCGGRFYMDVDWTSEK